MSYIAFYRQQDNLWVYVYSEGYKHIIKAMQYLSVISYGVGHYFEYITVDFAIYVIAFNYVLIISKKK